MAITDPILFGGIIAGGRIPRTNETQKIPGTTTALYRAAKKVMEVEATNLGAPIKYTFRTDNDALIKWALDPDKGRAIFFWDEIIDRRDQDYQGRDHLFVASTSIQPRI